MRENIVIQLKKNELETLLYLVNFTKSSFSNILKCTVVSLLLGAVYYLNTPRLYEAYVTIKPAMVGGVAVESPEVIIEKINLRLYAQNNKMKCNKYKYTNHKELESLTIISQEESVQKAKTCLEAQLNEISNEQNELAEILIEEKKQIKQMLTEELNEVNQYTNLILEILKKSKEKEIILNYVNKTTDITRYKLKEKIFLIERELDKQASQPLKNLRGEIDVNHNYINKGPMFFLGLSLISGILLGFLFTIIKNLFVQINQ